ncbi:DUF3429 domain-containing protein [Veronia nyctiphanis]|uniref:DUF3429 domain-containing protein n=1 Tax=Veronia nyctiphanis TaxID=1278244 RepID=UPI001F42D212|nr:DUF3429 domain-containing protein [Veronia nyctiphanis]
MKSTAWGYGAMGLIPFVAIGILFPLWPDSWESGLINLFTSYSMVILAFMAGAVWGASLDEEKSKPGSFGLTTAIVFSLIAFAVAAMPLALDY